MIEFDPTLVHEWLRRSTRHFGDKEALVCGKERLTYKAVDEQSDSLARHLMQLGVKRHDRVVIFMDNCCEAVVSLYGILKAGGVFVLLNGQLKSAKLKYILGNSGARVVITNVSKAKTVAEAVGEDKEEYKVIWAGSEKRIPKEFEGSSTNWDEAISSSEDKTIGLPRIIEVDLACLIYTSGSTGEPKGVMTTHHNMVSAARSIIQYIGNEEDDIVLDVLPLSFDYGLYQVIMAFMFGGTVIVEKSFVYLHQILETIGREKVTGFPIVPTVVAMLLKLQDLSSYDFSSVRYMTNTGAALPVEHIKRLQSMFGHIKIFSMFGLTECKRVGYLEPEELGKRPNSVGKAMPNCEVFVVDEDDKEVEPGQVGELIIRGANVMQGYWGDGELTKRAYHKGRWPADRTLYSGDYFKKDEEGFLYFLGRKDDMIKSKGERISPKEIENNICAMKGVAEAAVIGLPDEIIGQAIKAFVATLPGVELTEQDVLKYCSANMEGFMVPRYIEFMDSLPKTANGKIDKKQLKAKEVKKSGE